MAQGQFGDSGVKYGDTTKTYWGWKNIYDDSDLTYDYATVSFDGTDILGGNRGNAFKFNRLTSWG